MDPKQLFPVLAAAFAALAVVDALRKRRLTPAARTWVLLALVFAAVSAWLRWLQ